MRMADLAAVAEAVEGDLVRLRERLRLEPFEDALVLADDDAEEREPERVELPLKRAEGVLAAIRIVRRKGDEALLGETQREGLVGAAGADWSVIV